MIRAFGEHYRQLAVAAHYDARELAKLCGVSVRQLQRDFKHLFGRSPQDWLNEQKIMVAREQLLAGTPVKLVATGLGYKQSSHFCRHFKFFSSMTPSQYISAALLQHNVANR